MKDARLRIVEPQDDHDPLREVGAALSGLLSPGDGWAADGVGLELRPEDGSAIRIERQGDALVIRGAVLTLRPRHQPHALAGARTRYF
jgi:hypothetical protein